jgi:glucosamine kinase
LGSAEGGAANVHLDFEGALHAIRAAVIKATEGVRARPVRLGLGLAGASEATVRTRVAEALRDLGPAVVTHDGDIACLGAHAGQDGGLVIAGTGSAGVLRLDGCITAIGGRGFLMGDDGSGARLGLEAWRRALRAADGFEPHTGLSHSLMHRYDHDIVAVVRWARTARSSDFAKICPLIVAHAERHDPLALELVKASADSIAEIGSALQHLGAPRLALTGGLAPALTPYLPDRFRSALRQPAFDALDGALLLAGCPLPPPEAVNTDSQA